MAELLQWNICGLQANREELVNSTYIFSQTLCHRPPRN